MAVPLNRGKPYYALFTASPGITPVENDTITTTIGAKYSFAPGNSVIISGQLNTLMRFEAIVSSYNASTGSITLSEITNIKTGGGGSWPQSLLVITLAGERGSKITSGNGLPDSNLGRIGDMYIDSTTGNVYIKS